MFWFFGHKARGVLAPQPGTCTPCIGKPSLNHWTTREVPRKGLERDRVIWGQMGGPWATVCPRKKRGLGHRQEQKGEPHDTQGKDGHPQAKEGGLRRNHPADTLTSDFSSPELWENDFLLFKPRILWNPSMTAWTNPYRAQEGHYFSSYRPSELVLINTWSEMQYPNILVEILLGSVDECFIHIWNPR